MKRALITGITGQDGALLARFLLGRGYEVHGLRRRSSLDNTTRLEGIVDRVQLHEGDLTDTGSLYALLSGIAPDEIYNLGAQSDVAVSFASPEYTANTNGLGPLRLLEAIRVLGLKERTRFYQASTSELFGAAKPPQKETTPFYPRSPYAVAKLFGYWIVVNYREAYGLFAANGILFNHESPWRGAHFVTRKITRALCRIALGFDKPLALGNLDALRDWGHAQDAIEMQWAILQQDKPDDYVIATGSAHSVRDFVNATAAALGFTLKWQGRAVQERGVVATIENRMRCPKVEVGQTIVVVDPRFFRPSETDYLLGDASKARAKLGFSSKISFQQLVEEMVAHDWQRVDESIAAPYQTV